MEETKFEFMLRMKDHVEPTLVRTIEDDLEEWQIRRECLDILNNWQGDCPVGVDAYKNGDFYLSEDIEE